MKYTFIVFVATKTPSSTHQEHSIHLCLFYTLTTYLVVVSVF